MKNFRLKHSNQLYTLWFTWFNNYKKAYCFLLDYSNKELWKFPQFRKETSINHGVLRFGWLRIAIGFGYYFK